MVAGSAFCACAQSLAPASATACRFESIGTGMVSRILDGRSFQLSDGREVRVAAVEVPPAPGLADTGVRAASGRAVIAALDTILAGQSVELRQSGPISDRYGRLVAHAYFFRDGAERSAAHELLARGHARVAAKVGHAACAAELLARERQARAGGRGLWALSDHAILAAEHGTDLLAEQGRFTIAEGKVHSVRESGGTIYMNFGRRWSEALTVTILKRDERIFVGAGLQPSTLENRRLRVRGYVEERNGPRIEAKAPEQIEIADRN
jgi:endonuclease YncB( thermonuclease family)